MSLKTSKEKIKKVKKPKYHAREDKIVRRAKWRSTAFLVPSVLGAMLFFFVPYLVVVYYSTVDNPISKNFVGLDNFRAILDNGAFRMAVHNTAVFSAFAVPLAVTLSLALAIAMDMKIPFRTQFRTFSLTPMMVPVASIVLIWQVLFDYNGAVNEVITRFGLDKVDWFKSDKAIAVVVILFLWKNLGYNMILFLAALSSVPQDILEVASLEGANKIQVFYVIKLRYLASTIVFVTIMSLINSFKIFREVYLLTTDYPYEAIYMLQHFMNNKFRSLDYQTLSAGAVLMSLVMVVIIMILFHLESFFGKDLDG